MRRTLLAIMMAAGLLTVPSVGQAAQATGAASHSPGTTSHKPSSKKSTVKPSGGKVHVKGYRRKDGTYVAPHDRAAPKGK